MQISFTAEQKYHIIQVLKNTDPTLLAEALLEAAAPPNLCTFPSPVRKTLTTLQKAYRAVRDIPTASTPAATVINAYMQAEGKALFMQALQDTITDAEWTSELLFTLAKKLQIDLKIPPTVQMTLKDGKVFWRIIQDGRVVYDRQALKKHDVTYTLDNSCAMNWEMFKTFKNSGKRYSPVKITKARFVAQFSANEQVLAGFIWDELKQCGILNSKDRLTHVWRVLSNQTLLLPSIEGRVYANETAAKREKVRLYNLIATVLQRVANDPLCADMIPVVNASLFRPERSLKKWAGNGKIKNKTPTATDYCSQIWDVAVHQELDDHRNSAQEKNLHLQKILNYDHIPASAALAETKTFVKDQYDSANADLLQKQACLQQMDYPTAMHDTRYMAAILTPEQKFNQDLYNQLESEINRYRSQFNLQCKPLAYTVAIPRKLHKRGITDGLLAKDQLAREGNVFLEDIKEHLDNFKDVAPEYGLAYLEHLMKALGAFRLLYRTELKSGHLSSIPEQLPLGMISSCFFHQAADRVAIDELLMSQTIQCVKKQ
jgi:hypothetical protein